MNIKLDDFDGPLDLLLHLVKVNKMDIYNINIEIITKEYLDFINTNHDLTIDAYSEYLVMASELIHLKSKLLLNSNKVEEDSIEYEIDSSEELQRRLLEYQKIKEMTQSFRDLEEKRSMVYTKIGSNLNEFRNTNIPLSNDVSLDDLVAAFKEFLKRQELKKPIDARVTKKELSVEERIISIRNIIKQKKKINFLDLFEEVSKPYVIVTFLGILDMTKNKEIVLTQKNNFGEIYIEGCR